MPFENTTCNLCHSNKSVVVFPATPEIEDSAPADDYNTPSYKPQHFEIIRCTTCGLVRAGRADDFITRAAFYAACQSEPSPTEEANQAATAQSRLSHIQREFFPGSTLLDVNCGQGIFVAEAMKLGWQADGINPSENEVLTARRRSPWSHIYVGNIESAIFPAASYDVITLWNVLEHTDNPRAVIERLTPWLSSGGLLVMTLPNINSVQAQIMGKQWPMLKRNTLWYFSPKNIKQLLTELGFEKIVVRPVRRKLSLEALFNLSGPLKRISVWVPTGEMEVSSQLKNAL